MTEKRAKMKENARFKVGLIEQYLEIHTADKKELSEIHDYIEGLGKRAGLLKEFRQEHYL